MIQTLRFLATCCASIHAVSAAVRDHGGDVPVIPVQDIEWSEVGDPGNPPDRGGKGAVGYTFRISKYEVTNRQYAAFLNAVAGRDPNGLYHPKMTGHPLGGIIRAGEEGGYRYEPKPLMEDKPVVFLSFWDRCRFCNWLHNNRRRGAQDATTTEDGAYDLTDAQVVNDNRVSRKAGARYFLPDENEWYKAAYYDPRREAEGGPPGNDHYWLYPTCSDRVPVRATADERGRIDNDGPNIANYGCGAVWGGQNGHLTTVGSGGPGSRSYYGVYDMGGNVFEPNETIRGRFRDLRGGAWHITEDRMRSSSSFIFDVFVGIGENERVGFRLAAPAVAEGAWPAERVRPVHPAPRRGPRMERIRPGHSFSVRSPTASRSDASARAAGSSAACASGSMAENAPE